MYDCKSRYVQAIYKFCLRLDDEKKHKQTKQNKSKNIKRRKEIKIAVSLGYPKSYFYNKRCKMLL